MKSHPTYRKRRKKDGSAGDEEYIPSKQYMRDLETHVRYQTCATCGRSITTTQCDRTLRLYWAPSCTDHDPKP